MKAFGLIEVVGFTAAVEALDAMLKTANVELVTTENSLGGRLVTIIVQGSISDVKESVEHGKVAVSKIGGEVASNVCINNPHDEVKKLAEISSRKLKK